MAQSEKRRFGSHRTKEIHPLPPEAVTNRSHPLELFPTESRSTALALANNLVGRMGLVFGPMFGGILAEHWGSLPNAVIALAGVTLVAIPLVWSLPETKGIALDGRAPPARDATEA